MNRTNNDIFVKIKDYVFIHLLYRWTETNFTLILIIVNNFMYTNCVWLSFLEVVKDFIKLLIDGTFLMDFFSILTIQEDKTIKGKTIRKIIFKTVLLRFNGHEKF